jgi:hypothetical protein
MKKTTKVIDIVEMTEEEHKTIWDDFDAYRKYGIRHWDKNDKNDKILFEGEKFYRTVCYSEKTS